MIIADSYNGPLCPHSLPPINTAHLKRIEVLDRIYNSARKDTDGEMAPSDNILYSAVAGNGDHMRLYYEEGKGRSELLGNYWVVSWYWRCQTCGFVLPATQGKS